MTESFWESKPADNALPVAELEPETASAQTAAEPAAPEQATAKPDADAEPQPSVAEPAPDARALSVSVDDFTALEQRIVRTVALLKQERQARAAAETRAAEADARVREQTTAIDAMKPELATLRAEREQVRQRVERLLTQLDSLEL